MPSDSATGAGEQVRVNLDDLDTYRSRTEAMSQEFATDSSRSLETLLLFLLGSTDSGLFTELDNFGSDGFQNVMKFQQLSQDMTMGLTNLSFAANILGQAYQITDQLAADGLNRIDSDDVTQLFTARPADAGPLNLANAELAKAYEQIQRDLDEQEKARQERQAQQAQQTNAAAAAPPGTRDDIRLDPRTGATTVFISDPDPNQPWGPGRSTAPEDEIRPDLCRVKPGGVSGGGPLPPNMVEFPNGKVGQKVGVQVLPGTRLYTEPVFAPPVECTYDEGARQLPAPPSKKREPEDYDKHPRPFVPQPPESMPAR